MGKIKVETISALQLTKGLKKGEATFVAALVEEGEGEGGKEPLPQEIEEVLEEFKDVMPRNCPRSCLLGGR